MGDHTHNEDVLVEFGRVTVETKGIMGLLADSDQTPRVQSGISED